MSICLSPDSAPINQGGSSLSAREWREKDTEWRERDTEWRKKTHCIRWANLPFKMWCFFSVMGLEGIRAILLWHSFFSSFFPQKRSRPLEECNFTDKYVNCLTLMWNGVLQCSPFGIWEICVMVMHSHHWLSNMKDVNSETPLLNITVRNTGSPGSLAVHP